MTSSLTPTQMVAECAQIRNIKDWPRWPWLPMKKSGDPGMDIGVVYADDIDLPTDKEANGPIRVFGISIFQTSMQAAVALTQGVECPWPVLGIYTDVEALVDAGWRGD